MTPEQVVVIVVVFLSIDTFIVVAVVRSAVDATFGMLAPRYPALLPAHPFVRRNFCSLRVDWINMGHCVHIAVDRTHLHIFPAAILRWGGARPASIPWDQIQTGKPKFFGRYREARIGPLSALLPSWCLPEQAATDNPAASDGSTHR